MSEGKRDSDAEMVLLMAAVDKAGVHDEVAELIRDRMDDIGDSREEIVAALGQAIADLGYQERVATAALSLALN